MKIKQEQMRKIAIYIIHVTIFYYPFIAPLKDHNACMLSEKNIKSAIAREKSMIDIVFHS